MLVQSGYTFAQYPQLHPPPPPQNRDTTWPLFVLEYCSKVPQWSMRKCFPVQGGGISSLLKFVW